MKYIKQYKIFEMQSDSLLSDVKECFLPVIDLDMNNKIEIFYNHNQNERRRLYVQIDIPIYSKIVYDDRDFSPMRKSVILDHEELTEEICNSISHCIGMDMHIPQMWIHWLVKRGEKFSKPILKDLEYEIQISKTGYGYFPIYNFPEFRHIPLIDNFYIELKIINYCSEDAPIDSILNFLIEKSDRLTDIKIDFDRI